MKHLIKDNQIVQSGMVSVFTRENGQAFWGGYENMSELHYEDGWRDEIIPEFNPARQNLENMRYDPQIDMVVYDVVDKVINLDVEKKRHLTNLGNLRQEISIIVTQIKLMYDPEPEELTQMTPMIRGLYEYAKQEISELTEENVIEYVLRGPQVQGLLQTLKSML